MRAASISIEEVPVIEELVGQKTEFDLSVCSFGMKTKTIHKENNGFRVLLSLVSLLEPITNISFYQQNSKNATRSILGDCSFSEEKAIINVVLNVVIERDEKTQVPLNDTNLVICVRYSSGYTEERKIIFERVNND